MVARTRRVVWGAPAQTALDEAVGDIAERSVDGAVRVLTRALDVADSLSTLAERGRIVPEVGEPTLRELFVYDVAHELWQRGKVNDSVDSFKAVFDGIDQLQQVHFTHGLQPRR